MMLIRQARFASSGAGGLLNQFVNSWNKGDIDGAKAVFTEKATINFGSDQAIHRVPFSGVQSPASFFDNFAKSVELKSLKLDSCVGNDKACAGILRYGAVINRVEKETEIEALVHGKASGNKLESLIIRSGSGDWETAFSAHGESVKGTERKHF
ncbi:hypothetical protein DIPPA_04459 [Diplonema papillatum]|nr:hypothetical protein DIPPA_04459 [Diplonema papillatum]